MRTALLLIVVFACSAMAATPPPGLDVYIIRHAESMGNVTGNYTEENQCTFSPKGLEQVAGITEKLRDFSFDAILVSPTWRTRQTILPYLKAHARAGEIWPEIEECCCGAPGEAPPANEIPFGEPIIIGDDEIPYFELRDARSQVRYAPSNEAEGNAQMRRAGKAIRERFSQSGQKILIVTHSCSGSRIIEDLLGIKLAGRFAPGNAALTHLRQDADGAFHLLTLNDEPFRPKYAWQLAGADTPAPGRPLELSLVPTTYAAGSGAPYRIDWRLVDAGRRIVDAATATVEIGAAHRDSQDLLGLSLATDGAKFGDVWRLESTILQGTNRIQDLALDILFPSYHSLAGMWKIRKGDDPAWAAVDFEDGDWARTKVPGGWEKDALPDYDGLAWYRVRFTVPADKREAWGDAPLAILLRAIDDADETFLNGVMIGASGEFPPASVTAWDQARIYAVGEALADGTNVLAIRVSDWMGGGGPWKGPVAIGPENELRRAAQIQP